ncbi:hypothetical protein [Micromonospora sp. NPDC049679]|uniref:hypothetical protein n=1 Tax=Micromonospora sp. NPDC049679 TaxID=3155920 RepID=UPI0033DD941B
MRSPSPGSVLPSYPAQSHPDEGDQSEAARTGPLEGGDLGWIALLGRECPPAGIAAAWVLLGAEMIAPQLLGGAVVLAGAVLPVTAGRPRTAPVPVEVAAPAAREQPVP